MSSAFVSGMTRKSPEQRQISKIARRSPKRLTEQSKPGPCVVRDGQGKFLRYEERPTDNDKKA